MQSQGIRGQFVLGIFIFLGLAALGMLVARGAVRVKSLERVVTVKGLAEREVPADLALWPIQFARAANDLDSLYKALHEDETRVRSFLIEAGFKAEAITVAPPAVFDKLAQQYGGSNEVPFRYTASQTITVYSPAVDRVRAAMARLGDLGREGIVFRMDDYQAQPRFIFTGLNDIKPSMIEEATVKAREVAEKFAEDSQSRLGKIKKASQGQFTINDRDQNNPHIKTIRVVSTVQYYLAD